MVFENELERIWPTEGRENGARAVAIQAFAKANNLSAVIHDPGWGATFKKLSDP